MKLMTQELEKRFREIGIQDIIDDPIVVVKYFDPCGSATWYATEFEPKTGVCYGYVTGLIEDEWGRFSIAELEAIQRPFGLTIERDIYSGEKSISEYCPELKVHIEKVKKLRAARKKYQEKEQNRER